MLPYLQTGGFMVSFLHWVWQFPQHLLALVMILVCKPCGYSHIGTSTVYWLDRFNLGVSLGKYIFLNERYGETVVLHEFGHSVQSLYLGPLYLLVVGIPSLVFCNLWDRFFHKSWPQARRIRWYHGRYPENWADRLAKLNGSYFKE
jgi:hypothetical protein